MKSEFALAFNEITERFSLPAETVMEALEAAMISAYRRSVNASSAQNVEVKILPESGGVEVFVEKEAVEEVENEQTEVALEIALDFNPEAELGDMVMVESTPTDFGRVAAQTAKQVILQRLREAEREAQYEEYVEREGDLVHGTVHSVTPQAVTVGLGRAEAILPRNQQIPGEHFRVRDRIRTYVLEVRRSPRGPVIVVSRTHPHMLRRLLEMEVPEINQGLVEIKSIAREAGKRAKVAVAALREGVDPVGACVGMRGVRIQSIVRDLSDEKIDVIEWHPDPATFVAKALAPARVSGVYLSEEIDRGKTAIVVVPEDQLSLAIGRAGVNARLGAKLTGWRIDIKSLPETAVESLMLLTSDSSFAEVAEEQSETILQVEVILTKKEEGRPITPEEYQTLTSFVDRVQSEIESRRDARRQVEIEKLAEVRASFPEIAFEVELTEVDLSTRVLNLLIEGGYKTAGQVLEKLGMDEDAILGLPGIGPKAMVEITETLNSYSYPEPVIEIEEIAKEEVVADEVEGEPEPVLEIEETIEAEVATEVEAPVIEEEAEAEVEEVIADAIEELTEKLGESIKIPALSEEEFKKDSAESKQRRKEQSRIMEFDPELGEVVVRRRRKRDEDAWDKEDY
ncbi:MAG: transcription termination/antitermination protein NusA [Anaerolineales bacterium]|nr:MAG: transcription termination/antitermination protein NusA [Anaerolineales bacterium]